MAATDTMEAESNLGHEIDTLGHRIRQLRKTQGRTLDSLAHEIGLTKGYLSKVETGRQIPPLATLLRLAKGLGTDVAGLVESEGKERQEKPGYTSVSVVRADERRRVTRGATPFGYDCHSLVQDATGKRMSPFLFSFPSQIFKEVFFGPGGEEMMFVLSGIMEFTVGNETFELMPGDCIYFNPRQRHRGRGKFGEAKALVVLYELKNRDCLSYWA